MLGLSEEWDLRRVHLQMWAFGWSSAEEVLDLTLGGAEVLDLLLILVFSKMSIRQFRRPLPVILVFCQSGHCSQEEER